MKALVIGAGICGPVTAMALQRAGIGAGVYEARGAMTGDAGSYLTVAANGLDALRVIGCDGAVLKAGFPTPRTVLFSGTGKRLGAVPLGPQNDPRRASHTIKRADLHRALHEEAARRGVSIEFGRRLVGAEADGRGVRAMFQDGSHAFGDLLIGSDGVHSLTRTIIDPGAPKARYVGLLNFGGYTPGTVVGDAAVWHMIFGARAFFGYVPDTAGGTVWFTNLPRRPANRSERESTTADEWKQQLIEQFADDRGPARDLIAAGQLQLAADNTYDLPSVPIWHSGPRMIIGDAAHAPSPSSGQGASMAIEDGVVLAKCLRDMPRVEQAFATFERIRRARVERIVAQGARSSSTKAAGRIGRAVRDLALPFVFRFLVTEKSQAWMYDHHIDWESRLTSNEQVSNERAT
jgi:2-polyprenyl-6-methoxyphenol hydroxylase-like FAD-dependent oxidoreductase